MVIGTLREIRIQRKKREFGAEWTYATPSLMPRVVFGQGPAIAVTLEFEHQKLRRSTLAFADRFECQVLGEADPRQLEQCLAYLKAYSQKRPLHIDLPLEGLPCFRTKVLSCLSQVPFGTLLTYGELAILAGSPKAARAVGSACHYNPWPLFIPCHRVIAAGGKPGGFAYHPTMKLALLDFEK
jgi:O-6-methylguanine DNA methyltransferase